VKPRILLVGLGVLSLVRPTLSDAGVIQSPVGVVANTIGTAGGSMGHLIDQSGLSIPFISGETDFDTYISLNPTSAVVSPTTGWAAGAAGLPGYLEFDLGSVVSISSFVMWNQNTALSVNSFSLSSATNESFTSGVTDLGTFTAAEVLTDQVFIVSGVGEFVRMEINTTHGGVDVNLGEVAFDTEVIPEPVSLVVFGMGLVGLGLVRRR
jgi:hypothetical protein